MDNTTINHNKSSASSSSVNSYQPTKRSSISISDTNSTSFKTSNNNNKSRNSSDRNSIPISISYDKDNDEYRSRSTSISLGTAGPSSPTYRININEPDLISHHPTITSPPTTTSSSTSSSFHLPQNPRRRTSLSISSRNVSANGSITSYPVVPTYSKPRTSRSRTMSYSRISSSPHSTSRHDHSHSGSSKPKSTKTRKAIITLLVILSLFLIGTVIVLSSVSYFLNIPNWAYLTESEVSWRPSDIIHPLKDPLDFNVNEKRRIQRRKEWRDVTDDLSEAEPLEASGVLGTETLPESWKELEEEMEQLDAAEEVDVDVDVDIPLDGDEQVEGETYDDSVESEDTTTTAAEAAVLDHGMVQDAQDDDGVWGIDGEGTGGYWMKKDWNGKVQDTESWDRLFNVTTRPGETIPRLIHQTWKSDVLPEKWRKAWKECREGMPDYEYMLWTDDVSREFIAKHYPAHLQMFDSYEYPIQRADSIRYFILHHFGGVYMDLDIGCRRRLDPLLQGDWEVILPITKPVGVSNDLIFSSKGSAFMDDTVHGLSTFNHQYFTNYPTVMFSTGPMFLSAQYALYSSAHPLTETHPRAEVRILPKSLYGKNVPMSTVPHSFFSHFYGSSWHADDAGFITFLGAWGKKLMWVGLVVLVLGVIRLIWLKRKAANGGQQYQLLSILPTSSSNSGGTGNGNRSGASTPTSTTGSSGGLMSPSTTFDLPGHLQLNSSDIANVFKRAGHLILAAPATLLYGNNENRRRRQRTGLLYFVPALFQPDQVRRRGRTASEASQLPLRTSRRDRERVPPPPPYEPSGQDDYPMKKRDETMDEVDAFLNSEAEGETSGQSAYNDNDNDNDGDGEWEDWRRKSDVD